MSWLTRDPVRWAQYPAPLAVLLVFAFSVLCQPAHASTWQICSLALRITDVVKQPFAQLQARVLKVTPASATVECPEVGATLTFTPETPDYQSPLPRKQWPTKGQSVQINYRYLDGICKGDGHDYACRIKHYPMAGR
jgi:hypothetical protein